MKKRSLAFICCLPVLLLFFGGCFDTEIIDGDDDEETKFAECQSIINGAGVRYGVPGIVLFIKTAKNSHSFIYNFPSVMLDDVSANSLFRVGSITKTYIATLALRLQEMNILSVDQTIGIINVPGIAFTDQITMKLLLCHRSGIGEYIDNVLSRVFTYGAIVETGTVWNIPMRVWTFSELLGMARGPQGLPDLMSVYSSTNYLIAGKMIDCVYTGEYSSDRIPKIGGILNELILNPQGLADTHYLETETSYPRLARGYEKVLGVIQDVTEYHPSVSNSGGSVITSAADLADFVDKLFNEKIINSTSLGRMLTNYGSNAGLGVFVERGNSLGDIYSHGGSIPGYYSIYKYYFDKKTAVVLLMNTATNPTAPSAQTEIIRRVESLL